jgi:dTDP-4-amino-4,6-dideoxy-D-galactose acyltransferase
MDQALYRLLEWDTQTFGFKTARIIPERLDPEALQHTLQTLNNLGVVLAYWMVPSVETASSALAVANSGALVDQKVTYVGVIADLAREAPRVAEYEGPPDAPDLLALAIESGRYSRFRVDPRFPRQAFERLYHQWIINSVQHTIADATLVIRSGEQITGLVTVGEKVGRVDIGLIAVSAEARGQGLATQLVHAANAWGRDLGYTVGQVVTQGANQPACRLYERCGYSQEKSEDVFHFWLGT